MMCLLFPLQTLNMIMLAECDAIYMQKIDQMLCDDYVFMILFPSSRNEL